MKIDLDLDNKIHLFVKYVNKKLRHDIRVDGWAVTAWCGEPEMLQIEIDYIGGFHSRDVIDNIGSHYYEDLYKIFDHYFEKHINDLINIHKWED